MESAQRIEDMQAIIEKKAPFIAPQIWPHGLLADADDFVHFFASKRQRREARRELQRTQPKGAQLVLKTRIDVAARIVRVTGVMWCTQVKCDDAVRTSALCIGVIYSRSRAGRIGSVRRRTIPGKAVVCNGRREYHSPRKCAQPVM